MQGKKSILKEPVVILGIVVFIAIFILLIIISYSINNTVSRENEADGKILSIENYEAIYNIDTKKSEAFVTLSRNLFPQIYPETSSITIQEDSLRSDDNTLSFSFFTDKNTKFNSIINNETILIKNSANEEIISYSFNNFNSTKISPHLLSDYFPYKNTLSNNDYFEAKILENKKDVEIMIMSCVSKEIEKEALEKTKEYIELLDSDSSFFKYSVKTLCF